MFQREKAEPLRTVHAHTAVGEPMNKPRLDLKRRLPRYAAEMIVGFALAALIMLALIATVSSVPFIYQGY
jgi:hypothetical protein